MRRRRGGTSALAEVVSKVYPSREPQAIAMARVCAWWSKAAPRSVALNARPVRLHQGVLLVRTSTATWANELALLKDQLLSSLRHRAPEIHVRDMRFQVGPLPDVSVTERAASKPESPAATGRRATELPEEVARALASIRDDTLREAVARAALESLTQPHVNK